MSVDQVRTWVLSNDYFTPDFGGSRVQQGNDVFVPTAARKPHIHIGRDFIVYSKTETNHSYLIETGGVIRQGRIAQALTDVTDDNMKQLLRYMSSQL